MRDKDTSKNGVFQSQIWEGKNRVFTLHVQGKFKRKPNGPICFYLAALDDFSTLGSISKRFGKMWLAFARNWEEKLDINFKVHLFHPARHDSRTRLPCNPARL